MVEDAIAFYAHWVEGLEGGTEKGMAETRSPALVSLHTVKSKTKKSPRWGVAGLKGCSFGAVVTICVQL